MRTIAGFCFGVLLFFTISIFSFFCQLRHSVRKDAFEEQDHDGITPEVLDCIVREASLREMGRPEQADDVKNEALRARLVQRLASVGQVYSSTFLGEHMLSLTGFLSPVSFLYYYLTHYIPY